jgi:hypothetical protein
MAAFSDLYGEHLSRELGSSDTTQLFTTVRRKAAINRAQEWFVTQTECITKTAEITLADGIAVYDLEIEIPDDAFLAIATKRTAPYLKQVASTTTRYMTGDEFVRRDVMWLDQYEAGWRERTSAIPVAWYEEQEGGERRVGVTPPPSVAAGETWTLYVPYIVLPSDMTADADEPFTVDGDPKRSLKPWHDVLALFAASELEKLRKGLERSTFLRQQAEQGVLDFLDKQRVPGGKSVRVARSYRRDARSRTGLSEYGPYGDPMK